MRQQNDELLKLTQREVALTVEQAKRLGASKKQIADLIVLENRKLTIKTQDKEIDAISAEFDAIRKDNAKDRLKAEEDLLKLNEKQREAGDKALNYLEKYREDMDIILEQIQLKNDG